MKHTDSVAPDRPVRSPYTPPRVEVYAVAVEHGFVGSSNAIEDPTVVDDDQIWDYNT